MAIFFHKMYTSVDIKVGEYVGEWEEHPMKTENVGFWKFHVRKMYGNISIVWQEKMCWGFMVMIVIVIMINIVILCFKRDGAPQIRKFVVFEDSGVNVDHYQWWVDRSDPYS